MRKPEYRAVVAVVVLSGLLLLPRLGSQCLNGEEATVALLAERALKYGLPLAHAEEGLVTQEWGYDSNRHGVWVMTPWLPIYVCASGILLFGDNTFAVRLPFALAGVISATLLYFVARGIGYSHLTSIGCALLLAVNVQFLLFCRRVGPHALAVLLAMLITADSLRLLSQSTATRWKVWLRLGVWQALLFHVDYWIAVLQGTGLLVLWFWNEGRRFRSVVASLARLVPFLLPIVCAILPFAVYVHLTGGIPVRWLGSSELPAGFRVMYPVAGVWEAGQYLLSPLVILAIVLAVSSQHAGTRKPSIVYGALTVATTCAGYYFMLRAVALPARYLYFAHVLPAFTLLLFETVVVLLRQRTALGLAVVTAITVSNLGEIWLSWLTGLGASNRHFVPPVPKSYLLEYLREIAYPPAGPIDRLVRWSNDRHTDVHTVFASYEAEPLMFHLRTRCVRRIPFEQLPDVIILRSGWLCEYDRVLIRSSWQTSGSGRYRVSWQRASNEVQAVLHCAYVRAVLRRFRYRQFALPPAEQWQQNSDEARTRYYCPDSRLREVYVWLRK